MTRLPPQGASALGHLARAPRSSVRVAPSPSLSPSPCCAQARLAGRLGQMRQAGERRKQRPDICRMVGSGVCPRGKRRGAVEPCRGRGVCRWDLGPMVPAACIGLGPGGGCTAWRELCREQPTRALETEVLGLCTDEGPAPHRGPPPWAWASSHVLPGPFGSRSGNRIEGQESPRGWREQGQTGGRLACQGALRSPSPRGVALRGEPQPHPGATAVGPPLSVSPAPR